MPGLSILLDKNLLGKKQRISELLASINHLPGFQSKELISTNNLFAGYNIYPEYPFQAFNYKNYSIIIEGKIYNKKEQELFIDITRLVENLETPDFNEKLKRWLISADGDFIVVFINRENNFLYIFNDIVGRLPLYYYSAEGCVNISRYLGFITKSGTSFEMDEAAICQFFLLGYMLGKKTLYKNICNLRPASLLTVKNYQLNIETIHQFNFDHKEHGNLTFRENLEELTGLFGQGIINRAANLKKNIVTLSGGLDSRMVAACMYKNNVDFDAATMSYKNGYAKEDIEIAQKLASLFNVKLTLFEIGSPSGKELYDILKIKEGMNSLATSPIVLFYEKIKECFGEKINFITGDNGDKLIYTIDKSIRKFSNLDQVAEYIIDQHSIINIDTVASMLQTDALSIKNDIVNTLRSFPEENLSQKYIHFRVIERSFKYAFQGEDRHRNYFWHFTPFWSGPLFNYIMNCPDSIKIKHKLFAGMINIFSPEAIKLPYSNFRSSVISLKGKVFMNLVYHVYPSIPGHLREKLKEVFFGGNPKIEDDSVLLNCIIDQMKKSEHVSKYIHTNAESLKQCRKVNLLNILTITSAIENYYDNDSSLKKYFNEVFN